MIARHDSDCPECRFPIRPGHKISRNKTTGQYQHTLEQHRRLYMASRMAADARAWQAHR